MGDGNGLIWGAGEDLVPPSDEEEFEEWAKVRETQKRKKLASLKVQDKERGRGIGKAKGKEVDPLERGVTPGSEGLEVRWTDNL